MMSKAEKERRKKDLTKRFYEACASDQVSRALELLESGADINGLVVTVPAKHKETALHGACFRKQAHVLEILVSRGANLESTDSDGATPLLTAANWNNISAVCFLLDSGAKINARNKRMQTALHKAVGNGNETILTELLRRGASVDCVDCFGQTPLHVAAHHGTPNSIVALLDAGADDTMRTANGETALEIAIARSGRDLDRSPCDDASLIVRRLKSHWKE